MKKITLNHIQPCTAGACKAKIKAESNQQGYHRTGQVLKQIRTDRATNLRRMRYADRRETSRVAMCEPSGAWQ